MPNNYINLVMLSGEINWIKIKYATNGKTYVHFGIKQIEKVYDEGQLVNKAYKTIFAKCFNMNVWNEHTMKEGVEITVQGKIDPFINSNQKTDNTIIAQHIVVHNNKNNETQAKREPGEQQLDTLSGGETD